MVYNFQQGMMAGASAAVGGYTIDYSGQYKASSSAYQYKTFSAGDQKTWTLSAWVRRTAIGVRQSVFSCYNGSLASYLEFQSNDTIQLYNEITGGGVSSLTWVTTQVFRDPGSYYHVVWQYDTTQATANNRSRLWVNGVEVTAFTRTQTPAQNAATGPINSAYEHRIGRQGGSTNYFDGGLAEIVFIDGSALDPSSFGETDAYGNWVPKTITGVTYGTNGFYLDNATIGTDVSGNNNNFTNSNVVQVTDTPTNVFATWNPLSNIASGTIADGALKLTGPAANGRTNLTMAFPTSGKWYLELEGGSGSELFFGISSDLGSITTSPTAGAGDYGVYNDNAGTLQKGNNGVNTAMTPNSAYASGNKFMLAYDADNLKVWFGKNGTWLSSGDPAAGTNAAFTVSAGTYIFNCRAYSTAATLRVGSTGAFSYTLPTGFQALCTANLPEPSIKDGSAHFQTTLYTGTGSALTVSQSGNSTFTPDFVWIKSRSGAYSHHLQNILSGFGNFLITNGTDAETNTNVHGRLTSVAAGNFSLSVGSTDSVYVNASAATYAAWQWKANGAGVSNTSGSITSSVSANATAGFSVVTYTGTGANATVGHGLGVAPKLIIVKDRANSSDNWPVYHADLGATKYLELNTNIASTTGTNRWNSTAPTSSVFSIGNTTALNTSGHSNVAYCFAEIDGFSKIGSYTGNGSADGPFVYCGFKPALVIIKKSSASNSWWLQDSARNPYNVVSAALEAQSAVAEVTTNRDIDLTSNGFKIRNANDGHNGSSGTYIYIAFAQHPFGGSGVSPATAR